MNNHPVGKNYVQLGMQAHQEMEDWLQDPNPALGTHPAFDEDKSRARHLLHHDGEMGRATFRHGDVLIGPVEDQSLHTMMEKKLEK